MKKHWDKILLSIATIATVAVFLFFLSKTPQTSIPQTLKHTSKYAFKPTYIHLAPLPNIQWKEPTSEDEYGIEIFDVFTPPRIWWNAQDNTFIFQRPEAKESFGLKLLDIKQSIYPLRLKNISGNNKENVFITLYNTESDTPYTVRIHETFGADKEFKIIDFINTFAKNEKDIFAPVRRVTVHDSKIGEDITLSLLKKDVYIPGKYTLILQSSDPYPQQVYPWENTQIPITINDTTFTFLSIDLKKMEVTIEKTYYAQKGKRKIQKTEERTLSIFQPPSSPSPIPQNTPIPQKTPQLQSPEGSRRGFR